MDKVYYFMTASDLDALCEWMYDKRKEWNETKTNSSTPLKCKLYMLCISEYLVNTFVLFVFCLFLLFFFCFLFFLYCLAA